VNSLLANSVAAWNKLTEFSKFLHAGYAGCYA
jgi:hypothetical protein